MTNNLLPQIVELQSKVRKGQATQFDKDRLSWLLKVTVAPQVERVMIDNRRKIDASIARLRKRDAERARRAAAARPFWQQRRR